MFADHRRQFEAVEVRHADVDQNDGDFVLQQNLQRFRRRRGLDEILVELAQNDLVAQQLGRLIVDQKNVDLVLVLHGAASAMQPHAQDGQQLLGIDRLGEIVGGAGLQAFFAVAFHRLCGQGDNRQAAERAVFADVLRWSDSRPFPAS